MPQIIYLLCGGTSILCSGLLVRGYLTSKSPLLFWSAIGFAGLAVNNVVLCLDLVIYPELDLFLLRSIPALLGLLVMIFGLIRSTV